MIEIRVIGSPAAQGNHRASRTGHIYETTKGHPNWREAVKWAAVAALRAEGYVAPALKGPLVGQMIFTVRKPKSAPKKRRTYPDTKPDLSKYLRATEDALTEAGVWEDDARVIGYTKMFKVFPGEDPDALDVPGAVIRIWPA